MKFIKLLWKERWLLIALTSISFLTLFGTLFIIDKSHSPNSPLQEINTQAKHKE